MAEENEDPNKNTPNQEGKPIVTPTQNHVPKFDKAMEIVERREKANEKEAENLDRKEALMAREAVGGYSEAGQTEPPKPKETDEEFTEKFERGEINLAGEAAE